MKTLIVIGSLILLMSCGKKTASSSSNIVDLNQPTIVTRAPKAVLTIDMCESLQPIERCNCIDRVAFRACGDARVRADNSYTECLTPYLEGAYRNYCTINRANAYSDADMNMYMGRFRQGY